jgi:hypothetical protein
MKILELTARTKGKAPELMQLEGKLQKLSNEYRFDRKRAESDLKVLRQKGQLRELQDRLRGVSEAEEAEPNESPAQSTTTPATESSSSVTTSAVEEDNSPVQSQLETPSRSQHETRSPSPGVGDEEGGMFGVLMDEFSSATEDTEVTEENESVNVRDMSLPRHFSGNFSTAFKDAYFLLTHLKN